jgi:hypothetical protein
MMLPSTQSATGWDGMGWAFPTCSAAARPASGRPTSGGPSRFAGCALPALRTPVAYGGNFRKLPSAWTCWKAAVARHARPDRAGPAPPLTETSCRPESSQRARRRSCAAARRQWTCSPSCRHRRSLAVHSRPVSLPAPNSEAPGERHVGAGTRPRRRRDWTTSAPGSVATGSHEGTRTALRRGRGFGRDRVRLRRVL